MGAQNNFERQEFTTSRALEFFSEKELTMQLGYGREDWIRILIKELVDNALDACEQANITPEIEVILGEDYFAVRDNGPGLKESTIKGSLDYMARISTKSLYVSPTRGQLGNALKCVWAASFVVDGERGLVEAHSLGYEYRIEIKLDPIAQEPKIHLSSDESSDVQIGTFLKVFWNERASSESQTRTPEMYNRIKFLLQQYGIFNPHAGFSLTTPDGICQISEPQTDRLPDWKFKPNQKTSSHWYTNEKLRFLVAGLLRNGNPKTVRELVATFDGYTRSNKQKIVTDTCDLTSCALRDLVIDGDISATKIECLLSAMQTNSAPIKPNKLGVLGENANPYGEKQRYKKAELTVDDIPYVIECYFSIQSPDVGGRVISIGLNFSPVLKNPFPELLLGILENNYVDARDTVLVAIHITSPRFDFTEHGKGRITLPWEVETALKKCLDSVCSDWKKAKKNLKREVQLSQKAYEKMLKDERAESWSIKDAAYYVMEQAYMHASNNNTLPANARQIMYAARPLVMELTDGKCWANSNYFTQGILNDFIKGNPELTAGWDVVFDARGHLVEPHTNNDVDLGTLEVRKYIKRWCNSQGDELSVSINTSYPTHGPVNRFKFALFIEKEGFTELFKSVQLAERYDMAIMSTKGMSSTASRQLVERLSEEGVTILVLHDFDKSGFSILGTLSGDTDRYQYATPPNIIDLGLRLEHVEVMELESEEVDYGKDKDPKANLRDNGATEEECEFLVSSYNSEGNWYGKRVELNAMTSQQFIDWLEERLEEVGVEKFMPNDDVLEEAWERAWKNLQVQQAINKAIKELEEIEAPAPPLDFFQEISDRIQEETVKSWDEAVYDICEEVNGLSS